MMILLSPDSMINTLRTNQVSAHNDSIKVHNIHLLVYIPQCFENFFINNSEELEVKDIQTDETDILMTLINLIGFSWKNTKIILAPLRDKRCTCKCHN